MPDEKGFGFFMNILVTGGSGFLGGYVMAALEAAGHEAYAYDVAPPGPSSHAQNIPRPHIALADEPQRVG